MEFIGNSLGIGLEPAAMTIVQVCLRAMVVLFADLAMVRARSLSEAYLRESIRMASIENIEEVEKAVIERNGHISVIKRKR